MIIELFVLIALLIILGSLLLNNSEEYFTDTSETPPSFFLQSCPTGYTSFTSSDGSKMCCNGEVVGNKCIADKKCALIGSMDDAPNCTTFVLQEYKEKGQQCPSSMPSYYENSATKIKGCTNGELNKTLTGPFATSQPMCKIYGTLEENINALDSCQNHKEKDDFPVFGLDCTKTLTQNKPGTPVLITIQFTDSNGIRRSAHTRASMQRFLDATQPGWRDKGMIDLLKNITVAEVAKAYYIDRTIQQVDVQV